MRLMPSLLPVLLVVGPLGMIRAADKLDYNRDVRPILAENCFFCHGPDKSHREADLRLDVRETAVEMHAIVPGDPGKSLLVERIFSDDPDQRMPPPDSRKQLTPRQKDLLKRWIAEGAPYAAHWAYVPLKRPEVPIPTNAAGVRNPIDAFVLQTLEARGISLSLSADKRRLLRRLSLDLIGLPPTDEEVQAFLRDDSPQAYERQVERLLKSPRYGERMAVAWLDVVRFADTVGFHGDQNQNIFPYRDYVIDAFNRNKPFDQFTIEQLAGDLLPNPTTEQRIASGFNRLNMVTREGGAQPKEYLAKYAADRVRTVGTAWLGSTLGCCECHDHKYDPFTAKDFYQLSAFFADIKQWGVYADYSYTPNPDLKGFTNDYPFPPEIEVTSPYLQRRHARLTEAIHNLAKTALQTADADQRAAFTSWCEDSRRYLAAHPDGWLTPKFVALTSESDEGALQSDGSILLREAQPPEKKKAGKKAAPKNNRLIRLQLPKGMLAAVRVELLPHEEHHGSSLRGATQSTIVRLSAELLSGGNRAQARKLAFHRADADLADVQYSMGQPVIGVLKGWKTAPPHRHERQQAVWLCEPIAADEGDELAIRLTGDALGCLRISVSPFASLQPLDENSVSALRSALETSENARTPEQRRCVRTAYLLSTGWSTRGFDRFRELERDLLECREGRTWTLVTEAWEPTTTRVLPRGNWMDASGEIVEPAPPHFLPQLDNPQGHRLNRLDLARWLVSPRNPLTARTIVNRFWKQFFGAGLSAVVEDLGAQGEAPSHPELLDWLAVEFRDSGWSVKHLVKLIVMSNTYRQDSKARTDLAEIDPQNRLLAAQSPRRLEAEFVRDNALFIAGLLDTELGGPSARPYQPANYYENLQFPDRDYLPHSDERQYRRGVYMHWQRTFPHPMLANFDAPSREDCIANRVVSNTPQQALTLLNDPTFVEAARVFAAKLLSGEARTDAERLRQAFQRVAARPPQSEEQSGLLALLNEQRADFAQHRDEAEKLVRVGLAPTPDGVETAELAAWTSVCRVLLNLHESITRY